MGTRKITKRTFFKSIGFLAVLGVVFSWFRRGESRDYPMVAMKDPRSVERKDMFS